MEWKIGEVRQVNGEWYQCVRSITCSGCVFNNGGCIADKHLTGDCSGRLDGASVIFKRLKKVGKPHKYNINVNVFVQDYKLENTEYSIKHDGMIVVDYYDGMIGIEIKQREYGKSR